MGNHSHLVVETPRGNLVAGMKWFLGAYTSRFNQRRRKGDVEKVRLAARLRAETTMTLKWIARELHMGAWTHVSNLVSQQRRRKAKP
jgi:hypothetical protein